MGAAGTSTAALGFGGNAGGNLAITESWNGTNWTEVGDLNVATSRLAGAGTNTAALAFGGNPPTAATEEWSISGGTVTITTD